MLSAALIAGMAAAQVSREISFSNRVFTLSGPEGALSVSIDPGFQPMNTSTGRLWLPVNGYVMTFDKNGLGFRRNNHTDYTTFATVATSDKIFSAEELAQIKRDIESGTKRAAVSGISGWEQIGNKVYLLLRWDDSSGRPWLETLFAIDFNPSRPKSYYLGRFTGISTGKGAVSDRLMAENGLLYAITQDEKGSYLSQFALEEKKFGAQPLGPRFFDAKLIEGSLNGFGLIRSSAGTWVVHLVDREAGRSHPAAEFRGTINNVYPPAVLDYTNTANRRILLNLSSGAEVVLPNDCGVESTHAGIFLWTPKANPTQAALYSPPTFRTLARWQKP